ncbi:hypothetical protein ABZ656_31095 [Streptomyces sp. NPDC007095]|jgi:hypothetical protein|uniref:hypothetical protein n=1 Tax=Streptomyces sp. NPDC007095 TaxID=3154482 RepID=UPI0015D6435D
MAAPRKYPDELRERAIREVRATGPSRMSRGISASIPKPCAAGSARPMPMPATGTTG